MVCARQCILTSCPALPCPALPCPALPCAALRCAALRCPALPCRTLTPSLPRHRCGSPPSPRCPLPRPQAHSTRPAAQLAPRPSANGVCSPCPRRPAASVGARVGSGMDSGMDSTGSAMCSSMSRAGVEGDGDGRLLGRARSSSGHWHRGLGVRLGNFEGWKPQKVGGCGWSRTSQEEEKACQEPENGPRRLSQKVGKK